MSTQPLYMANCTPYYLAASLNDQTAFPIALRPNTAEAHTIPWTAKALWGAQAVSSGVLAENSNILKLKFSESAGGGSLYDKVYVMLATPGFGGTHGPQPSAGALFMWIFTHFVLFSQYGKARFEDFGRLPPAPGWRAIAGQ